MENLLAVVGLSLFLAAAAFALGYHTAQTKNQRFHKAIQQAYSTLIAQNDQIKNSPSAIARSQGFAEGYEQGVADSHAAVERLIHNQPID